MHTLPLLQCSPCCPLYRVSLFLYYLIWFSLLQLRPVFNVYIISYCCLSALFQFILNYLQNNHAAPAAYNLQPLLYNRRTKGNLHQLFASALLTQLVDFSLCATSPFFQFATHNLFSFSCLYNSSRITRIHTYTMLVMPAAYAWSYSCTNILFNRTASSEY